MQATRRSLLTVDVRLNGSYYGDYYTFWSFDITSKRGRSSCVVFTGVSYARLVWDAVSTFARNTPPGFRRAPADPRARVYDVTVNSAAICAVFCVTRQATGNRTKRPETSRHQRFIYGHAHSIAYTCTLQSQSTAAPHVSFAAPLTSVSDARGSHARLLGFAATASMLSLRKPCSR